MNENAERYIATFTGVILSWPADISIEWRRRTVVQLAKRAATEALKQLRATVNESYDGSVARLK